MLIANYGSILRRRGRLYYAWDPGVHAAIHRWWRPVPKFIPLEPVWCNPTPPIAATIGGFSHPHTGAYCHPILAQRYAKAMENNPAATAAANALYFRQMAASE